MVFRRIEALGHDLDNAKDALVVSCLRCGLVVSSAPRTDRGLSWEVRVAITSDHSQRRDRCARECGVLGQRQQARNGAAAEDDLPL